MRRFIVSFVALAGIALCSPAFAAPPAPSGWTGFYVGGNIGYAWADPGNTIALGQPSFGSTITLNAVNSNRINGPVGGLQAGYNWQIDNYLVGLEADIQTSGQTGSHTFFAQMFPPPPLGADPTTITETNRLDWFGTVRGRAGIVSGPWLFYATGGLAYGDVNVSGSALPANPVFGGVNAPYTWNQSATKIGWTVGAGVEAALAGNWTWKIEYLYVDLGQAAAQISGGVGLGPIGGIANCIGTPGGGSCRLSSGAGYGPVTTRFTDNIIRLGVNYRF